VRPALDTARFAVPEEAAAPAAQQSLF
jgi:hypothetical protein